MVFASFAISSVFFSSFMCHFHTYFFANQLPEPLLPLSIFVALVSTFRIPLSPLLPIPKLLLTFLVDPCNSSPTKIFFFYVLTPLLRRFFFHYNSAVLIFVNPIFPVEFPIQLDFFCSNFCVSSEILSE